MIQIGLGGGRVATQNKIVTLKFDPLIPRFEIYDFGLGGAPHYLIT